MNIHKFAENEDLDAALQKGEPILAVISFDGKDAYMGHIDECMEHHILLAKSGLSSGDVDKYFRIVFDSDGADWTFACPSDYKRISDRTRRIAAFYKDGIAAISAFLVELGLLIDIKIPKRYRRHLNALD
ncbi:MAG: hypothetical protein LBB56_04420 [Chitinispirillales bacterium]|jgi:hypothetical protein|nr:hypothetical protein [Chitinispirillales bacterium]